MKISNLVSIIMPAYNAEKYIAQAITSVLEQSFGNWELIIINDGSIDATVSIVQSFDDDRINFIDLEKNSGVSAARNVGLSRVRGEYITFLDADDVLPPRSLEIRVQYLESHSEVDLVDGAISIKDIELKNELRRYDPYYCGPLLPRLVRLDSSVYFGVVYMFRKDILGDVRFKENMTHAEDLLFYMELSSSHSVQYGFVSETIYWYRSGHSSAMTNLDGLEKGYMMLLHNVNALKGVSIFQNKLLRLKVARIMFLSWLRRKEFYRAFYSAFVAMNIFRKTRV